LSRHGGKKDAGGETKAVAKVKNLQEKEKKVPRSEGIGEPDKRTRAPSEKSTSSTVHLGRVVW